MGSGKLSQGPSVPLLQRYGQEEMGGAGGQFILGPFREAGRPFSRCLSEKGIYRYPVDSHAVLAGDRQKGLSDTE